MYAVVDVETTGLSPTKDRIIEIAVVGLDAAGQTEWAWTSVLNPLRDVGPTRIHGLHAKDVVNAPTFDQVGGYLVSLFANRVIVGHNVSFDWRFIDASFERMGVVTPLVPVTCTCQAARQLGHYPATLEACCAAYGITNEHAHSALADAMASAELLTKMANLRDRGVQKTAQAGLKQAGRWPTVPVYLSTGVSRPPAPTTPVFTSTGTVAFLDGVTVTLDALPVSTVDDTAAVYLAALERALADRILTTEEIDDLSALAEELELTPEQGVRAHRTFLQGVAASYWADGVITASEHQDLTDVATMLRLPASAAAEALRDPRLFAPTAGERLNVGDRVVFTGDLDQPRDDLVDAARAAGLKVTASPSRLTKMVVAADPLTQSGKAKKARELGVQIVTENVYQRRLHDLVTRDTK